MPYIFRVDEFVIRRTRAAFTDTDVIGLLLRVGDQTYPPVLVNIGDVQDGSHPVNAEFGPIDIPDDATPVVISYSIVNSGNPDQLKSDIKFVLDAFADAGANMAYAFGTLVNRFLMFPFHDFEFSSCDGVVAMDVIAVYGRTLSSLTRGGTRYSETRRYPGLLNINSPEYNRMYPSPGACGETSDYSVTWSVESVPAGTGQRELVRRPLALGIGGYANVNADVQNVVIGSGNSTGAFTTISISNRDGGIVHEDQDPKGSVPDLSVVAAFANPAAGFVIAATEAGHLTFATALALGGGTVLEPVPLPRVPGVVALAGFSPSGPLGSWGENIFVGMNDGTIRYLLRDQGGWTDRGLLNIGSGRSIVGLASYFAERDGYGHVIAACADGDVLDIRVSPDPTESPFLDVRANIPHPIAVAGYFGLDDYHHIYSASEDGNVHEIWFPGVATAGQGGVSVRTKFSGVFAIAAYSVDVERRHYVVAATRDGSILATSWRGF